MTVEAGYARARELTRRHSKSFYFSSIALFGSRRRGAFALYAFCRRLDDIVDGDNAGDGSVQAPSDSKETLFDRLSLAREAVSSLYGHGSSEVWNRLPWHASEVLAFRDTVERFRIPERPFHELISGMEMDLTRARCATFEELRLYCYRVAGVVGELMTPVLGFANERCLPFAAELGIAMQLTNILRDVKEDALRGRIYLPADELSAFGFTADDVIRFSNAGLETSRRDAWRGFMQQQIARARSSYQLARNGVPDLRGFGSQRLVRLMSAVYGGILDVIEQQDFDVFARRAHVPMTGKLARAAKVLFTPTFVPRAVLPEHVTS